MTVALFTVRFTRVSKNGNKWGDKVLVKANGMIKATEKVEEFFKDSIVRVTTIYSPTYSDMSLRRIE